VDEQLPFRRVRIKEAPALFPIGRFPLWVKIGGAVND
jgi:hypothetical protein